MDEIRVDEIVTAKMSGLSSRLSVKSRVGSARASRDDEFSRLARSVLSMGFELGCDIEENKKEKKMKRWVAGEGDERKRGWGGTRVGI